MRNEYSSPIQGLEVVK